MNGAEVIAEILKREGTEFLACYPRNAVIDACAAIDIRPIICRQERVGVGMADGFSRIRRGKQNGVFAAQHGPGIENAFSGVAQAYAENVPLLVIPEVASHGPSSASASVQPTPLDVKLHACEGPPEPIEPRAEIKRQLHHAFNPSFF